MKYFEETLPSGYKVAKVIDAKDKKTVLWFNIISLIPIILLFVGYILSNELSRITEIGKEKPARVVASIVVFFLSMIAYVILHELTHGAAYKILTKQKLTFGITLSVAFCGVPKIYVYRKASLIATLAPFVVFLPVFTLLATVLQNPLDRFCALFLLAMHIGGCVGDLWCTYTYLFKLRNPKTLTNDTGPKQTFYIPE